MKQSAILLLLLLPSALSSFLLGNCCVIKPSEAAVASSNLMNELVPKCLDPGKFYNSIDQCWHVGGVYGRSMSVTPPPP